jgi:hypothetical protein
VKKITLCWLEDIFEMLSTVVHITMLWVVVPAVNVPRPFNDMFFTPLYGVRNTGCPQISTKKFPQISNKKTKTIFLDVIDPPEAFSAPQF